MRLLFVTPFVPHAGAGHGGGSYLATVLQALATHAEVGLCALRTEADEGIDAEAGPWVWQRCVSGPRRGTGLGRIRHQMRMLWRWRRLPLVVAKHREPRFTAALRDAVATFAPSAVFVEMSQMAQYLPALRGLPTVLTDHEGGSPANLRTGLGAWADARDRRLWRRYVHRTYAQATVLQAVTREDADELSAALGRAVRCRGPAVDIPASATAPGSAPPRALFLGDYRHAPNPEAAQFLVHRVLPRLRAVRSDAELWLAGPNQDVLAPLRHVPGVRLVGFVADLPALLGEVRLLLAPLFSGGGFRMKCLTALAHGLPVVTNALGARGCAAPAAACRIVEGEQALAAAALELLVSPAAAASAGATARSWASTHLSGAAVAASQIDLVHELLAANAR